MTLDSLKTTTYNEAEYYFRQGIISEELWAEYRHLWQSSAPRFALKACWCEICQATSAAFEPVAR